MIRFVLILSLFLTLWGEAEDFITDFEYGQMLYRDPRGASCAACHGETGSGEVIGEYTDKQGRTILLSGPDIRQASLDKIRKSVHKGSGVMPRYFLTEEEIRTIHAYLQQVNRHKAVNIATLFDPSAETNRTQKQTPDRNQSQTDEKNASLPRHSPEANTSVKSAE